MRLLKYPLEKLASERANALLTIDNDLLILSSSGHVLVWLQQSLVDTAYDKISIKDLTTSDSFLVGNFNGEETFFLCGTSEVLFVGSEHKIISIKQWKDGKNRTETVIYECLTPSAITDIKLDTIQNVLFVLNSNPNKVLLFDATSGKQLSTVTFADNVKPTTCVIDTSGNCFTVFCADRSIVVYQFNNTGAYKQLNRLNQFVQVYPLHYKITMPPQANMLPVINSVKSSSSTSVTTTVLLDINNNYKIASTLVSPSSNSCQVLVFSPVIYEKENIKKGTKTTYNLLATSGNADGTILVWNTKRMKPLFNAIQVSETPINDMVWSNNGLTLFGVSNDNILYTFAFQVNDLGVALPHTEIINIQKDNKQFSPLPIIKEKDPVELKGKKPEINVKHERTPSITTLTDADKSAIKKTSKKKSSSTASSLASAGGQIEPKIVKGSGMEFNSPSYIVPKDLKRKPKVDGNGELSQKKQKRELEPMDFLDTGLLQPNVSFSRVRLATPKIRLNFKYSPPDNTNLTFEVKNGSGNDQKPTIISLTSKVMEQENQLFEDFIPKLITMCTAGNFFWSCTADDGTIYVYSDTGKRLLPPLILGVPISFLEASTDYLLCVTSIGELYCWDIKNKKLKFPTTSVFPILNPSLRYSDDILTRAENITMCSVTKNGVPLITLSNGDGYMFDESMETWLLISDSWWAYGSQYWDMSNSSSLVNNKDDDRKNDKFWNSDSIQALMTDVRNDSKGIVNLIERRTNDELNRKGRIRNLQRFARAILMKEGFENLEEIVTLSHLENRLLISLRLGESTDFTKLIVVYCIRLSEMGYTDRLEDVLHWLYNDGEYESNIIEKVSRVSVLKDILMGCAHIRHVQRVTTAYATALNILPDETPR